MPGTTFLPIAGPCGTLLGLAAGMFLMLVIGANFSYLMSHSARTGGVYSYAKDAFGQDHAFLCAWFLCLSYLTIVFLNGTALFVIVRTLLEDRLQVGFHYSISGNEVFLTEASISVFALVLVGLLFVRAKPLLQRILKVMSIVLLVGSVVITVFCLPRALSSGAIGSFGTRGINRLYATLTIVILAPWAFVGFDVVSFDTAHFAFEPRRTPWVVGISILIAGLVYMGMVLVSIAAVPDGFSSWQAYVDGLDGMTGLSSVPTFYAAYTIMGVPGLVLVVASALSAIFTGIISAYRAAMRILSTMAEDHILSEKFLQTTYSILFIMVISAMLALLGRNTLIWFVDLTSFGAIVAFGYVSAAAFKTAKAEGNRPIETTGMLGTVFSIAFALVQMVPNLVAAEAMGSESFLLLSLWCLLGFVFYWRTVTEGTLADYRGMSTSGVVLFALILYSALMWFAKRMVGRTSIEEVRQAMAPEGFVVTLIIFTGLAVMLYLENLVRKKHEVMERERIRAVESNLAKSQFLFNMSHDIRTPMNAIIGYTNLALKEPASELVHGYLEKIDASSQHLLSLINDILEMSRIENGKVELEFVPTDLRSILDELGDLFSDQMRQKGIDFSVHGEQVRNRYVWCDRKNLNRVLFNIVSNAYKFTPAGGAVSVAAWETVDGRDGYGSYEIRVLDSGIGMSKEFAEKLFTAFERERTSTVSGIEGTGLGLAISKTLVDLMGGSIEVLTSPGAGTEMIVRISCRLADEGDVIAERDDGEAVMPVAAEGDGQRRLLLVEDNAINMEIACMVLEQEGYEVETAENGAIAVEMVSASEPGHYDAVLMDIQMPVMDGYAATRAIRALEDERLSAIPIVAMTANAFKEDVEAARNAGMQGHIAKPIDIDKMRATLSEVLGR